MSTTTIPPAGGGSFDGDMNGLPITNLEDPTNPQDAATKAYVDANISPGGGGYAVDGGTYFDTTPITIDEDSPSAIELDTDSAGGPITVNIAQTFTYPKMFHLSNIGTTDNVTVTDYGGGGGFYDPATGGLSSPSYIISPQEFVTFYFIGDNDFGSGRWQVINKSIASSSPNDITITGADLVASVDNDKKAILSLTSGVLNVIKVDMTGVDTNPDGTVFLVLPALASHLGTQALFYRIDDNTDVVGNVKLAAADDELIDGELMDIANGGYGTMSETSYSPKYHLFGSQMSWLAAKYTKTP